MNVWRERLNRLLLPLARRAPFSPNSVTVAAFLLNVVAAIVLASSRSVAAAAGAALLIGVSGLFDALDGAIARAQQKSSRFGDFLDHFLDRVSDAALLSGWCVGTAVRPLLMLLAVAAILLVGYIGTQIEASFGARSYEGTGRAEFLGGMIVFVIVGVITGGTNWRAPIGALTVPELLATLLTFFALLTIGQRLRLAARLANEPHAGPRND